jgi:hypothetical protein
MIRRRLSRAYRVVRFVWWHDMKTSYGNGRFYRMARAMEEKEEAALSERLETECRVRHVMEMVK